MPSSRTGKILHITVGAAVQSHLDLTDELRLLKAALLYADRVKLWSLTSSLIVTLLPVEHLSEDEVLELLAHTAPALGRDPHEVGTFIEQYKRLRRKKRRNRDELLAFLKAKSSLDRTRKELWARIGAMAIDAGAEGLLSALNTGLVEFERLDVNSENVVEDFLAAIKDALLSGETYPLFDDSIGKWVSAAIREGHIVPLGSSVSKAKQVGLSSGLFIRLPLFDNASVDQLVDIRRELEKPLVRFRSAIIRFSHDIDTASWDKEFAHEVDQVFLQHVQPAVLEIEEAYRSNRFLQKFAGELVREPLLPGTTSAIGILISQANQVPAVITQAAGILSGAAVLAYKAYREWQDEKEEIEKNQLYFYYRAGKSIAR